MPACARCAAELDPAVLNSSVARAMNFKEDSSRPVRVRCPCGAAYRHCAQALLGLTGMTLAIGGGALSAVIFGRPLFNGMEGVPPLVKGALLMLLVLAPMFPIFAGLGQLWPLRPYRDGPPPQRDSRKR